jgi:hypothetical protein
MTDGKVELGEAKDIYEIVGFIQKFHRKWYTKDFTFDPEHVANSYTQYLQLPHSEMFLYRKDGEIVGVLGGVIVPQSFSPDMAAYELVWFVNPNELKACNALIKAFEEWGAQNNVKKFILTRFHGFKDDPMHKYLNRIGYEVKEHSYSKET